MPARWISARLWDQAEYLRHRSPALPQESCLRVVCLQAAAEPPVPCPVREQQPPRPRAEHGFPHRHLRAETPNRRAIPRGNPAGFVGLKQGDPRTSIQARNGTNVS